MENQLKSPPRLAEWLLQTVLPRSDREALLGDLNEEFNRHLADGSWVRAYGWYWRQVASTACHYLSLSFRPRELARRSGYEENFVKNFGQDFRYALRNLWSTPLFSLIIIATISIGIAANTAVYTVVDNIVLNPFPFPRPDRLVGVGPVFPRLNQELAFWEVLSPPEYLDLRENSRTLEDIVAWDMGFRQVAGSELPESVFTAFWWGNAFEPLQVSPELGRGFTYEETVSAAPVAILSYRFWQRRFGGHPGVVGDSILVNDSPHTVIGIMPRRTLIYGTDLWTPMAVPPERFPRNRRQFQILARITEGATIADVNTELRSIARNIERQWSAEFEEYENWGLVAQTWTEINTGLFRPAAALLMGTVAFVLLLICATLASFFLARAMRRHQEFAVRTALGASRIRLMGQVLCESLVLAMAGGLLGFLLSIASVNAFVAALQSGPLPLFAEITINYRVFLFSFLISLACGLLFGAVPAIQAARTKVHMVLKSESRRSTGSPGKHRLQSLLVGAEVAIAVVLLVGGGLMIHSFLNLQAVDRGFRTENLLAMRLTLPWEKYQGEQIVNFFDSLVEHVESLPGVRHAGFAAQLPPNVFSRGQLQIEGRQTSDQGQIPTPYLTLASEGYFETLGIPLLEGRIFQPSDRPVSPLVAVINDAARDRYFPDQDPVGRRIKRPGEGHPWLEIVGVVGSTRNRGPEIPPQPEFFASARQMPGSNNQFFLILRTEAKPLSLLPSVRAEVAALDPNQPIYAIHTLDDAYAASTAQWRTATVVLGGFNLRPSFGWNRDLLRGLLSGGRKNSGNWNSAGSGRQRSPGRPRSHLARVASGGDRRCSRAGTGTGPGTVDERNPVQCERN